MHFKRSLDEWVCDLDDEIADKTLEVSRADENRAVYLKATGLIGHILDRFF